jgi:hypothetical protein
MDEPCTDLTKRPTLKLISPVRPPLPPPPLLS